VIRFDAVLDRSFTGKVVHVNSTPEPSSWLDGNVKRYAVLVSIDDVPEALRLGMTAVTEIDTSGESAPKPSAGPQLNHLRFDKDGDGKVSKAEMPEPLRRYFDRLDHNKDGVLDEGEWKSSTDH
jgi:hypothetical protein